MTNAVFRGVQIANQFGCTSQYIAITIQLVPHILIIIVSYYI